MNGNCLTSVWIGIHEGGPDLYDTGAPLPGFMEPLVEDGANGPLSTYFLAQDGAIIDGSVGGTPICPGESGTMTFDHEVSFGQSLWYVPKFWHLLLQQSFSLSALQVFVCFDDFAIK